MMVQKKYVLVLVLLANCALAQLPANSRFDSLSGKSFEYLQNGYESNISNQGRSKIYAAAWLKKAKAGKDNYRQLALAYRASALFADKPLQLTYADSMVYNANRTDSDELIGASYMAKGILYYNHNQHIKALDSYLIADRHISKCNIPILNFQVKYGIAQIKYYLGFYDEAISLYKECIIFYEDENDRAYLNSLHGLALCYTRVGKYRLAAEKNRLGIQQGIAFEETDMASYFKHSDGINQYYSGNYNEAIRLLSNSLPAIERFKDYANESVAYFYIGKSNWELKRYNTAIDYFKKLDGIFQKKNFIQPDLRPAYEHLIDYYKKKNDTKTQLYYINQLLKIDNILAVDYKYLLKKIVKEYDTKELLKAKKAIENTVVFTRVIAGIIVLIMAIIIIWLIRKDRRNAKRFEELMNRDTTNHTIPSDAIFEDFETDEIESIPENAKNPAPDISKDIEDAIVKRLDKFEQTKKYLENDMNLSKMATILHTNSKYVTKVIAKHRGKGTIEYITELKLDYIIEMMKTDSRYRNYTHKALGEEAGFRTTQNFTRAFKSYTGITPTYFSYKLKKSTATDNSE